MDIRIYFEGVKMLRAGFQSFFAGLQQSAREAKVEISFIAAKDGLSAYRKAERTHPAAWNVLLKDSEEPIPNEIGDLLQKHGIDSVLRDHIFWMVELMESWFLACPEDLAKYYGKGFQSKAIGATQNVESIAKADVQARLRAATRGTVKGAYNKVKHAPHLWDKLDSERVKERAPHCRKLFDAALAKLAAS